MQVQVYMIYFIYIIHMTENCIYFMYSYWTFDWNTIISEASKASLAILEAFACNFLSCVQVCTTLKTLLILPPLSRLWTHRKKNFAALCNQEIVGLESVTEPDAELVRGLVQEHYQLTGSTVAERLLEDWGSSVKMFIKVWYLWIVAIALQFFNQTFVSTSL